MAPNSRPLGVGGCSYGGHGRERRDVVDYRSRRYDGGLDQTSRRERAPRGYDEPRRYKEYEHERGQRTYEGNTGDYYDSGKCYSGHSSRRGIPKPKTYEDDKRREGHGHEYHQERRTYEYEGRDRLGRNRRYEDEDVSRYTDPIKSSKHTLPEFHGELDPETYLEWELQVE